MDSDLDCAKPYSDKYSSVLCLRKQRDGVIGVIEEQIEELKYEKKRIDGLNEILLSRQ